MEKNSKQFKKMMSKKMMSYKRPHSHFETITNPPHAATKESAREWFVAKRDKKKLPPLPGRNKVKDYKYAHMPMDKFLKKYPEWKV